ncbi:hypothetical protein D3C74_338720 [compost metagenome]
MESRVITQKIRVSMKPSMVPSLVQTASRTIRHFICPDVSVVIRLKNSGTAVTSSSSVSSSGNARTTSIFRLRVSGAEPGTSAGGMWKSSARIVRSSEEIPNIRCKAIHAAVFPVPLLPISAVRSGAMSIRTGSLPKHRKLRSRIDSICISSSFTASI